MGDYSTTFMDVRYIFTFSNGASLQSRLCLAVSEDRLPGSLPSDKIPCLMWLRVHKGPLQRPHLPQAKGEQGRDGPCCCMLLHYYCVPIQPKKWWDACWPLLLLVTSLQGWFLGKPWEVGKGEQCGGSMGSHSGWGHPPGWRPLPSLPVPASLQSLQWPDSILGEKILEAILTLPDLSHSHCILLTSLLKHLTLYLN